MAAGSTGRRNTCVTLAKRSPNRFQNPWLPAMPKFRFLGRSEPSTTFFAHQHTLPISSVQDRCCVDRLRPPTKADKVRFRPITACPLYDPNPELTTWMEPSHCHHHRHGASWYAVWRIAARPLHGRLNPARAGFAVAEESGLVRSKQAGRRRAGRAPLVEASRLGCRLVRWSSTFLSASR